MWWHAAWYVPLLVCVESYSIHLQGRNRQQAAGGGKAGRNRQQAAGGGKARKARLGTQWPQWHVW